MADTTKPAGADPLAHTIYIWPSRELIASSWDWPEAWHAAYAHAASEVGREVAVHVLGGLAVREQSIELRPAAGWISFTVRVFGSSIFVSIEAFEGPDDPDSPGPDGGCEQPRSADGLILGLRGTGKCFSLVTFYGYLPPLPVGYSPGSLGQILATGINGIGSAGNGFDGRFGILRELPISGCDRSEAEPGVPLKKSGQPSRDGQAAAGEQSHLLPLQVATAMVPGKRHAASSRPPLRDQTGGNAYVLPGQEHLVDWTCKQRTYL
jgi:hypothetical protein